MRGDFNVVQNISEKFNTISNTRSMRLFNDLIGKIELIDPLLTNAFFTWSNFWEDPIAIDWIGFSSHLIGKNVSC